MQIELKDLRTDDSILTVHDSVEFPDVVQENLQVVGLNPVTAHLSVSRKGDMYRVLGTLEAHVKYVCSRCVDPFDFNLQTDFDETFTDEENDSLDPENEVHLVTGGKIVLDPYVKQAIDLALEYRPLCDVNCKGLCQKCGCNLNRSACNCDTRAIDPRFAVLEDLISKDESE